MKQKLTELKRGIDDTIIIERSFSVMGRTTRQQSNQDIED